MPQLPVKMSSKKGHKGLGILKCFLAHHNMTIRCLLLSSFTVYLINMMDNDNGCQYSHFECLTT